MKQRIYIETSIPSFYYEIRTEPDMIARKKWTQEWWDYVRHSYELVTSVPVLVTPLELLGGREHAER